MQLHVKKLSFFLGCWP